MFEESGELLGQLIIFFYVLTILVFFVKLINKNKLIKNNSLKVWFGKIAKFFFKYHKIFGLLTIIFILLHFFVQFNSRGLSITGTIAAATMIAQVGLGIYITKFMKNRNIVWLRLHLINSIIILVAILIHIE